ncbi:uncharacterized protein DUF1282 [Ciceribacter lividus]|uniref:Uncharacterized protein DUF1282 n=1 Tax=Ciceribacter lividus TaxID=1197950 RepID=A0A6I7HRC7_9HYPH|nr:Yip1 family protein [Ciceribacter lividus]RCW27519.1 uncharacterized protein DUF1282 [Ciceribacter lividus]
MSLVVRIKGIMLTPRLVWPVIAAEETGTVALYTRYVMPLAAVPAVAGFLGASIFGVGTFGLSIRVPLATGLLQMVMSYTMSLVMIFIVSLTGNALAPGFGGQKNSANALKLVAYSSTAAMMGGVFALVPALWMMMLAASFYSVYLLFLGVPSLMLVPRQKALPYTAVLVVCGIVLGVIVNMAVGVVAYTGPAGIGSVDGAADMESPTGEVTINTPNGAVTFDMGKMEAWSAKVEALGRKLEEAQQAGDSAAFEQVLKEMNELQREQPTGK